MSLQNFIDRRLPVVGADWLNQLDWKTVNLLGYTTASQRAAIIAGTSTSNQVNAVLTYINQVLKSQGTTHTEATLIGGVIKIPAGVYQFNSTVTIGVDQVVIEGDPGGATVIRTSGAFPAFTFQNATLQKIYGVGVRNIRFISNITARDAGSAGVKFVNAETYTVENCVFHLQTLYGVWQIDCITGRILNNQFDSGDFQNPGIGYGIFSEVSTTAATASGNNATVVAFNSFRRTVTSAVALLGQPSNVLPALRRECAGIQLISNHFESNYGDSVQLLRNRAYTILGNWFEEGGLDGAAGHGYIMDIATDDDEAGTDSGLNAVISIEGNVFGGHSAANADFQHIGLKFVTDATIEKNYFTAGTLGFTADCPGLVIRDNWGSSTVPTLAGALPNRRIVENNRLGPTSGFSVARPWGGSFFDFQYKIVVVAGDGDTTPSTVSSTTGRIDTLMLSNSGATNVTYLDDGYEGQEITLIATNGNTTLINGSNNALNLAGAANYTMSTRDSITFKLIDTGGFTLRWIELCRSEN